MNGSGNRKRAFAMGFSNAFVLKDIKTIVAASFPRPIHTKVLRVLFFVCVALCVIENCDSLKIAVNIIDNTLLCN